MLQLLKRFEEENADGELGEEDSDDEENDLSSRLVGIDIGRLYGNFRKSSPHDWADGISADELWDMLSSEERKKFESILINPDSEAARNLLSSTDLERLRHHPWWVRDGVNDRPFPTPLSVPESLIKPQDPSKPSLIYNISEVLSVPQFTWL
jgi:hypothetical protein